MSGSYIVHIEVKHYPKHCEDDEQRLHAADKLVDTGNPRQMVLDSLRGFADQLEERWAREDRIDAMRQRREDAKAAWEEKRRGK